MNKNLPTKANLGQFENKSLLIVDDDDPFRNRLSKAMENKGFLVTSASSVAEGVQKVKVSAPTFAIIDLRLNDGSGLDIVKEIHKVKADSRIIVLTGYGNIPTAVAAVKSGA
ncbi:MAG: response regulator, partial [Candidatus Fonsibacter ubiquis]|nr:response regulator [Candidatus Fonsibacter ubiquis]